MKKIIKPAEREEAVYFSDFSGKTFGEYDAPVEIKISFNYGSKFDGSELVVHVDDEEVKPILNLINQSISKDFRDNLKKEFKKVEEQYGYSIDMRDWDSCDREGNLLDLYKKFIRE